MPHSKRKIPQRIQSRLDDGFVDLVLEKEEQIQIRLRMQRAPAVPSNSEKREAFGIQPLRLSPNLQNNVIHFSADRLFKRRENRLCQECSFFGLQERLQLRARCHQIHGTNGITKAMESGMRGLSLRFLGWSQDDFADEAVGFLGDEGTDGVSHVRRGKHLSAGLPFTIRIRRK